MKYPKEYLDEIKTRLKVSTVVSKTVNLKKRGKEFVGLSPFKTEKTPSFTVNDEKGFYHCFSTSEHGNIFDFVMKTQNLKFGEAVKSLANLAGMRPYTFSKQDEEREKNWQEYCSIYNQYVQFYHYEILKNEEAETARNYLKKRNLSKEEVKKFKIGYVKKNPIFYEKLKKEFSEKILTESGLFYLDEKKNTYVERFRNRIIFPINNISGQPIGLGGRTIEEKNYLAKYINSPETLFFKKGSNLYNLDFARKLSNKIDHVYLVEGYMDVIGLNKNGIENVVANLGTSLTDKQILILNQFFDDIIICFDGDESGYKAALRAAENSIKQLQPEKKLDWRIVKEQDDIFKNSVCVKVRAILLSTIVVILSGMIIYAVTDDSIITFILCTIELGIFYNGLVYTRLARIKQALNKRNKQPGRAAAPRACRPAPAASAAPAHQPRRRRSCRRRPRGR